MIDTHMHGDSRSSEDFGEMYLSGIDTAITCAFYPYKLNNGKHPFKSFRENSQL